MATRKDRLILREAAAKFNVLPHDGIAHLVRRGTLVDDSPAEVARALFCTEGLSKRKIGDFLAKPKNQPVMQAWLARLSIAGMMLDEGIRNMVLKMRLPGEAQQIDRIIEKFAEEYFAQNPGRFSHVDTVYVLSFSIIMLNTDLHNPFVTRKMSCAAFVQNNRGIDQGQDMSPGLLKGIYGRIKAEPIRMDEDDMFESEASSMHLQQRTSHLLLTYWLALLLALSASLISACSFCLLCFRCLPPPCCRWRPSWRRCGAGGCTNWDRAIS